MTSYPAVDQIGHHRAPERTCSTGHEHAHVSGPYPVRDSALPSCAPWTSHSSPARRSSCAIWPTARRVDSVFVVRERSPPPEEATATPFLKLQLGDVTGAVEAVVWDGVDEIAEAAAPGAAVRVAGPLRRRCALRRLPHGARRCARPSRTSTSRPTSLEAPPTPCRADGRRPRGADRARCSSRTCASCSSASSARAPRPASAGARRPPPSIYHQAYRHGLLEHCLSVAQGVSAMAATVPGHRPRRRGHRRAAARHRQDRGLRADERRDRAHRRRQAPGRDPARLLPRAPRDRADRRASRPSSPQAVLHIVLSHHGKLEHGSPVVPCTREATLVHMIDNLGGTLGSFDRIEKALADGEQLVGASTAALSGSAFFARRERAASAPADPANSGTWRRARAGGPRFPALSWATNGQGHREAHPAAVADLVPDGGAAAGLGARDQAGRRGLLADERRGLRAPLLRRPRGARVARHRTEGGEAGRGLLRGRELHAAAGELLPAGDRVLRRGAGRAAHGAHAARRRVRLRGAAAAGAAAALLGQALAADGARAALRGAGRDRRAPAGASCRSGCRRSRPRSSAARRSSSTTTRSAATPRRSARWTPTTCSSGAASST